MKVTFLFGGALTAAQEAAVEHEIDQGNEVEVVRNVGAGADFDLLVYGGGFGGLGDLSNAISFSEYASDMPVPEVDQPDVTHVDDCGNDCGDCDDCEDED